MAFLATLARLRRGDSFLILAAFLALALVPTAAPGSHFSPQHAQVVLFWLANEEADAEAPFAPPVSSIKRENPVAVLQLQPRLPLAPRPLESHEAALLSGVRTNRWLI